jgi:hypothetical protein
LGDGEVSLELGDGVVTEEVQPPLEEEPIIPVEKAVELAELPAVEPVVEENPVHELEGEEPAPLPAAVGDAVADDPAAEHSVIEPVVTEAAKVDPVPVAEPKVPPAVAAVGVGDVDYTHNYDIDPPKCENCTLQRRGAKGESYFLGNDNYDLNGCDACHNKRGDWVNTKLDRAIDGEYRNAFGHRCVRNTGRRKGGAGPVWVWEKSSLWGTYCIGNTFNVFGYDRVGKLAEGWRTYTIEGKTGGDAVKFNKWGYDCYGRRRTDITVTVNNPTVRVNRAAASAAGVGKAKPKANSKSSPWTWCPGDDNK